MSSKECVCKDLSLCFNPRPPKRTLCPILLPIVAPSLLRFNPRPPKRTLCPNKLYRFFHSVSVSIHVLRRGRCVSHYYDVIILIICFNPRPPKRTLCLWTYGFVDIQAIVSIHVLRRGRCVVARRGNMRGVRLFQSTSSEEDVVSK